MDRKYGNELNVGDTIEVWWTPHYDTIISLNPYTGTYKNEPAFEGCQIAEFVYNKSGMSIFKSDVYRVIRQGFESDCRKILKQVRELSAEPYPKEALQDTKAMLAFTNQQLNKINEFCRKAL